MKKLVDIKSQEAEQYKSASKGPKSSGPKIDRAGIRR